MNLRAGVLAPALALTLMMFARPAYATIYSMPVVGRWSTLQVGLQVPPTPTWAHDVVLNASRVWNMAQVWFAQNYFPGGKVYSFVESRVGNATVTFGMPSEYACIAVGWTQYILGAGLTIIGAHTFLDRSVFNAGQEHNETALEYGLRLALHELGRVLGLGSVVDGLDIMDPIGTASHARDPPIISMIDLFALHVLASESSFSSPVIALSTDQHLALNVWELLGISPNNLHDHNYSPYSTLPPAADAIQHRDSGVPDQMSGNSSGRRSQAKERMMLLDPRNFACLPLWCLSVSVISSVADVSTHHVPRLGSGRVTG